MEKRTVLFVDDEVNILKAIRRLFMNDSFNALYAHSGSEAIDMLKEYEVHVIITDMRMPNMSGLDLLKVVRQEYPKIVRVVLSGYTQVTTLLTAINQGEIFKYITKPWEDEDELRAAILQSIEHYDIQNNLAGHSVCEAE